MNHLFSRTSDIRVGQKWRCSSLIVLIFSGLGFPILQFGGSLLLWMSILFLMNINSILRLPARLLFWTIFLMFSYVGIFLLKGSDPPYFVLVAMITALFVLSNYLEGDSKFYSDFSLILKWFMYYSLISIPLMIIGVGVMTEVVLGYSVYKTFGYLFWFSPVGGPTMFNELRMIGLTWEPGIWQMFLNINFMFALYERRTNYQLALALIATLTCFSTTGILVSMFVLVWYFIVVSQRIKVKQILIPMFVILAFFPLITANIIEKTSGQHMGSGATRIADLFTGIVVLSEYPFLGADVELAKATNNPAAAAVKTFFWRGNFTDGAYEGYLTVSNSNGYIIFLLDWGLPIGIFFLLSLFRNRLFPYHHRLNNSVILIILISMSAEAISRTGFFYFFILAALFLSPKHQSLADAQQVTLQSSIPERT
jgi:hypothetical protein